MVSLWQCWGYISSRAVYHRRAVQTVVYDAWRTQIACLMETLSLLGLEKCSGEVVERYTCLISVVKEMAELFGFPCCAVLALSVSRESRVGDEV